MLDALAIAAHPDDAEIACGGTLALLARQKYNVGILDLTRGELGSQGTVDTRKAEAEKSAQILKLTLRENLGLPDGSLSEASDEQTRAIVGALRRLRPEFLFAPFWDDRHPDHGQASRLCDRAVFLANLRNFAPELGAAHKVLQVLYYQHRTFFQPSFLVNISGTHDDKVRAIEAFESQVQRQTGTTGTLISSPLTLSSLTARDEYFGSMLGVKYAEPFLLKTALGIPDPVAFFRANPVKEPLATPGGRS